MIALLGATGTVGRHVAERLAADGIPARALTRDRARVVAPGIDAVPGDLRDPASLRAAFTGCDALFLLTPHGPDQAALERDAVDAALAAGIERIVKVSGTASSLGPNGPTATAVAHWHSEQHIEQAGAGFTFLRSSTYMQGLLATVAPIVAAKRLLPAPYDAPVAMVDARDVAAAAVAALQGAAPDQAITLTGPRAITYRDIAGTLGARHISLPRLVLRRALSGRGASDWEVRHALGMVDFLATGADAAPSDGVERLTGRRPTDISAFLRDHAEAFGLDHSTKEEGSWSPASAT